MTSLLTEHNWLVEHHEEAEKYGGRWIAILGQKIVSHGKTFEQAYRNAMRRHPGETPLITYILKKGEELLIV